MYLKSIEIIGFKSFANKTKLELKPGITAIVGPNGCGKSNISDAVRWVLGEQRAKALRGSNMQDVIFNGTDKAKPMGMAEVSLTLGDCSKALETDYDEICITRRVYRSNESGYFINRKACRLKDIQRLFMDTGIGTDSYSVLEQGKIDQILSARPDDRRAVFEEASGITKYKTDKKETLRKLEQTENNLIRLDDVIKEVKKQIISLQRQAGKARRYKELSSELKKLDLFISNKQIRKYEDHLQFLNESLKNLKNDIHLLESNIHEEEENAKHARNSLGIVEKDISDNLELLSKTKSQLDQAEQLVIVNNERIDELNQLSERNNYETNSAQSKLENRRKDLLELEKISHEIKSSLLNSKEDLDDALNKQKIFEQEILSNQKNLGKMRTQSIESESKTSKLQNELVLMDSNDRENLLKRERLHSEKKELNKSISKFDKRFEMMTNDLELLVNEINIRNEKVIKLTNDKKALDKEFRSRELIDLLNKYKVDQITTDYIINQIEELFEVKQDEKNQISILISELEKIRRQHANQEGEMQMIQSEKNSIIKRLEIVTFELNELEKNNIDKTDARAKITEQIQNEKYFQSTTQISIKSSNNKLLEIEQKRNDVFEYTTEKRLKHSENMQNANQYNTRREPLISRINELEELIKERTDGIEKYKSRSIKLNEEIIDANNKIKPLSSSIDNIHEKINRKRDERSNHLHIVSNAENDLRVQRSNLQKLIENKSKQDIDKAETVLKNDSLIKRLGDEYNIVWNNLSEKEIITNFDMNEIPDDENIENQIAELKVKLNLIGPVNLVAINEYEEYEERYKFLIKEQEDLLKAKKQLLEMIKKINTTTTDLFIKTFEKVNKEFQVMFKNLFGGGTAKLVLTDEDDILEAGIEIIASPPGKKLQSISLLSGGERTMTAVALLFSLFKVKPSPFCVLDELDAALDDANISRFVNTLKTFIKGSQFIIITHNRQTIAEASVIYGITMESKGISKVVSMQFADFKK